LEAVILKSLAKSPEERYPTGAALADALDQSLKARTAVSLLAKRSTAPRQTIPERVALNLGSQPLPPIPAGVPPTPPPPSAIEAFVSSRPDKPPVNRRPLILTGAMFGAGLLLTVLICLALFVVPSLMNRFAQRGNLPGGRDAILSTASAEVNATGPGSQSEVTVPFTPTPESALIILVPTSTPVTYELLIIRGRDGNSLIVVNMADHVLPLSLLLLTNSKVTLSGSAWDLENLAGGACVGAWKPGEDRELSGTDCQLVGERLQRNKKDLFDNEAFLVYYDGEEVGSCDKKQNQCLIRFSP
jgi:hypothetical protein